ncbi:hypothetical protein OROGR_032140 [Orobanche gracilis]
MPSQEILKIRYGTPLEAEEILIYIKSPQRNQFVAHILFFKIRPSQEILKIRDGTPMEMPSQEILKIRDEPSQEILKIRDGTPMEWPSQEILKIRDGTPMEAEKILTYIKNPQNRSIWHFCSKLDVPSNVAQKKRVARILFFKIRPSQEILKIRDVQKKRVARILFFKIRPSQEILKIRYGTPLEAEEILIYIKNPSKKSVCHFSSNLDVPTNVVQRKRVAHILFFKIRPSREILKIRDGTPMEKKRVARILFFKIRPSQEILKIRDGTPLEPSQEILKIRDGTPMEKRVARILFFKVRLSQEILKIRYGTPLEAEEILIYIKNPSKNSVWHFSSNLDVPTNVVQRKRVAHIMFFKIRPSQEILKIRDATPTEGEEILIYAISRNSKNSLWYPFGGGRNFDIHKKPSKKSVWHFSSNLDVPTNVVQRKRVAHILFFKIRPSQEILKIRDGTPLEAEKILTYIKKPSKQIDLAIL